MSAKRQTRLQLRRQPKTNATSAATPPISTLLSQYELLTSLCEHLSSADIVHLGATSREHWQYVASSPVILKGLIADSACDDKGIIAQARVFRYWKGDPAKATRKCRGKDANPCHDCGAMVCNACRFHVVYPKDDWLDDDYVYDEEDDETVFGHNAEEWGYYESAICKEVEENGMVRHNIETKKASDILCGETWQTFCDACEPLCIQLEDSWQWCECDLYSCFVEQWRCIPCVLVEEAKATLSRQPYKITFKPEYDERILKYWHKMYCECGRPEDPGAATMCRKCHKVISMRPERNDIILKRAYLQLGTCTDDRSDDPILSQLG